MTDETKDILGAYICEKYTLTQIRTRVNYERQLQKGKKEKKEKEKEKKGLFNEEL